MLQKILKCSKSSVVCKYWLAISIRWGVFSGVGVKHFKLRWPIFQQETNTFQLLTVTITFTVTRGKLLLYMREKGWLKLHCNCSPGNLLYGSAGVLEGSENLRQLSSQPARQQSVSFSPTFILFSNVRKGSKHLLLRYTPFNLLSSFSHIHPGDDQNLIPILCHRVVK